MRVHKLVMDKYDRKVIQNHFSHRGPINMDKGFFVVVENYNK